MRTKTSRWLAASLVAAIAPLAAGCGGGSSANPDGGGEVTMWVRDSGATVAQAMVEGYNAVLDAGGGNDASYWNALVPVLAQQTGATVVTYDRTGSGRSSDVPGAFSAAANLGVDDLDGVLADLGAHDISRLAPSPVGIAGALFWSLRHV